MRFLAAVLLVVSGGTAFGFQVVTEPSPASPVVAFGIAEVRAAVDDLRDPGWVRDQARLIVRSGALDGEAESYQAVREGGSLVLTSTDDRGALYGLLDIADAVRLAMTAEDLDRRLASLHGSPALELRGMMRVLTAEDGDLSPWFRDNSAWRAYLDDLARNRFNLLELHGVYRMDERAYASLLPYFIDMPETPNESPDSAAIAANLSALQAVVAHAADRGIRVALANTRARVTAVNLVDAYAHIGDGHAANVDFDWVGGGPIPEVGEDEYAVVWEGFVTPPATGDYTFYTQSDDGTRLYVNGKTLIDNWQIQGVEEHSGTVRLEAGKPASIRLEYLEWKYAAVCRLLWSGPGVGAQTVVPATVLSQPKGAGAGLKASYYTQHHYSRTLTRMMTATLMEAVPGLSFYGTVSPGLGEPERDLLEATYMDAPELAGLGDLYARFNPPQGRSTTLRQLLYTGDLMVSAEPLPAGAWGLMRDPSDADANTLWLLRTAGSNRLFRWFNPQFVRGVLAQESVRRSGGLSIEAIGNHLPQDPKAMYTDPALASAAGTMAERQWAQSLVWGRLAYRPDTPEEVFRQAFVRRCGVLHGPGLMEDLVQASRVVTAISTFRFLGPNEVDMAPEFAFGHHLDWDIHARVYDPAETLNVAETVAMQHSGSLTPSAANALDVARSLGQVGQNLIRNAAERSLDTAEARDLNEDLRCLGLLARYYDERIRALADLEGYYKSGQYNLLETAGSHLLAASGLWQELAAAAESRFRPFADPLRMGPDFTWSGQFRLMEREFQRLGDLERELNGVAGPQVGHLPVHRVTSGETVRIVAGVLADGNPRVTLWIRTPGTARERGITMKRISRFGFEAETPKVGAEGFEYRITAEMGGRTASWPLQGSQRVAVVR